MPEEAVQRALPPRGDAPGARSFEIWPENVPALEAFLALATQWRLAGDTGAVLGLDYPAAETVMRLLGVEDRRSVFADLRSMERAALEVFSRAAAAR